MKKSGIVLLILSIVIIITTIKSVTAKWIWTFILIFAIISVVRKVKKSANRRNKLFNGQRPNDDDYGYSSSNPIMTSTVSGSKEYLNKLRTLDGKRFAWRCEKSYCIAEISGIRNVMVDEYLLFLNGEKYKTIYICAYGHSSTYVPKDMKLAE